MEMEGRQSRDMRGMCELCNVKKKAKEIRLRYFRLVKERDNDEPVNKAVVSGRVSGRSTGRRRIR